VRDRKLRGPILVLVISVFFLMGGLWFYLDQRARLRQDAESELQAVAQLKVNQIAEWRLEILSDARALMQAPLLAEVFVHWIESDDSHSLEVLEESLHAYHSHPQYDELILVDREARPRLSLSGNLGSFYPSGLETINQAMQAGHPVLSCLHRDPTSGKIHMGVAAPLMLHDEGSGIQEVVGAVVLQIDPRRFLYPLTQRWPLPSSSAETLLVRREGDQVLFLNDLLFLPDAALSLRLPLAQADLPAAMAVEGLEGTVSGTDYRGQRVLASLHAVPQSEWYMVSKVDHAEVFAARRFRSALILAVIALALVSLAAMAVMMLQRARRSAERAQLLAAKELFVREERLRATLFSVGDAVVATDEQGVVTLMNPVAEGLTGWTVEEGKGRHISEIMAVETEDTGETVENPAMPVLRQGETVSLANHSVLVARDGRRIPIADSAAPIKGADGEMRGAVLVFSDQTKERAARNALEVSERRLRDIFEFLPVGIWFADKTGKLTMGNPAGVAIWGGEPHVGPEEYGLFSARRLPSGEPVAPEDWSLVRTLRDGVRVRGELLEIDAFDGKTKVILNYSSPLIGQDGEVLGGVVVNLDITERTRAEEALRRRFEADAALAQIATQLLLPNADRSDLPTLLLAEACRLTGSGAGYAGAIDSGTGDCLLQALETDGLAISKSHAPLVVPREDDGSYGCGVWGRALNTRTSLVANDGEDDGLCEGGSLLAVPVVAGGSLRGQIVLLDAPGGYDEVDLATVSRMAQMYGLYLLDVDRRRRLEENEARLRQALKMEAVGRLAGGVAHDFNNMLQVILGYGEMALEDTDPDDDLRLPLQEITKAGSRSADLTRQLLAFARKQTIQPEDLDLNEAVAGMLKMLTRLVGEDVSVIWEPTNETCPVVMDPSQIDQILANLLVNARDAIEDHGEVRISTERVILDAQYCRTHPDVAPGPYVRLVVRDSGCGMDRETLEQLFEPFFTTKGLGEGSGLGLSTVYGIVRQNGGSIDVRSAPGQGSAFSLYFPLRADADGGDEESGKVADLPRGQQTLLLVEDEEGVRRLATRMLGELGYTVVEAASPQEGLALAEAHPGGIDLVVADVVMPQMNGRQFVEALRRTRPNIRCLYMSGYPAEVIAEHGIVSSDVAFLGKPFTRAQLAQRVAEVLGNS